MTVPRNGGFVVNGAEVKDDLGTSLAKLAVPNRQPQVILHGDAQAPYGAVVDATLIAQRQGARVAFGASAVEQPPRR